MSTPARAILWGLLAGTLFGAGIGFCVFILVMLYDE